VTARIAAGECGIAGLMLESFLVAGAQSLGDKLVHGQSVTDPCMDFAATANLLAGLSAAKGRCGPPSFEAQR
jgi:3-deoxy-7-phosphoheptulonate synthase